MLIKMRKNLLLMLSLLISLNLSAQVEDDFEDFDPSMFQEASTSLKAFCTKIMFSSTGVLTTFNFAM